MATLTQVLEVNWIILYFVSGQVFFITGLVTGLQWQRRSDLEFARPLPWLAAFGIAYGLSEWGHIFIPLQALYLDETVVSLMVIAHLLLLAVSFFFLLQFGVELTLPLLPRHRWLRAVPSTMLLLWGGAVILRGTLAHDSLNVLVAVGDGLSRYLLCFPGALLSSVGLFLQARQMRDMSLPRIASYLTGAALAFLMFALVDGLIVPASPIFPASVLNYALLSRTIQIPAPVLRSFCGLAMAFFVVRSLDVFRVEADRRLAEAERTQFLAADRERIGRELHDGIIQSIYAAGLGLEEARQLVVEDSGKAQQQIRKVMGALDRTIQDIRNYIFDLRVTEHNRELEGVLEDLVQDLRLDTMLEVDLEVVGQRRSWMSSRQIAHITQVAREALSNTVQHARASHVVVQLAYLEDGTRLIVRDNGNGANLVPLSLGYYTGEGIANMQARARMLGGALDLASEPGQGFQLMLTVPAEQQSVASLVSEGQNT